MKILKAILMVLGFAIGGVLLLAATRPSQYHVERTATILAPPGVVFAQVNDFHQWVAWSPWEKIDPEMKRTYAGPRSGRDASYSWAGNDEVGEGRMTIVESEPDARVGIRLEFLKPWAETCRSSFALAPEGEGTRVTWRMEGNHNFASKVMCVFMDMDKMIGGDFQKGLGQLKLVAEAAPAETDPVASQGAEAGSRNAETSSGDAEGK